MTFEQEIFLILGSLVFVASGLLLTLPPKPKSSADDQESFEESRARTEFYLRKMREERGERKAPTMDL